jgi:anion-transporting  ArsA/GET3 family ATPase
VAAPTLLDRRLVIVTGKGGVGKSTVATALALLAVRAGKRVLVCEVNAPERVAPLLGAPPAGASEREALPGLFTVNVTPPEAMREYGLMILRFRAVYAAVFENRVMRYFLKVIPSLAELVMLGKILHEVRKAGSDGRPRWDLVVVDAPSTGHAVQLLRVPSALLDTVPPGPLQHNARWMHDLLVDPQRTAVALVTLPEEMPVNETLELDAALRSVVGLVPAALLVNAMPEARFAPREEDRLAALAAERAPVGPAAAAARLQSIRARLAAGQLARVRAGLDLPTGVLPLLPLADWGREAVDRIAAAIEAAPPSREPWPR